MSALMAGAILVGCFTLLCVALAIIVDRIIRQIEKNL